MDQVTVSSKGQIPIPKPVRAALKFAGGSDLMNAFAAFRSREREREDSRP